MTMAMAMQATDVSLRLDTNVVVSSTNKRARRILGGMTSRELENPTSGPEVDDVTSRRSSPGSSQRVSQLSRLKMKLGRTKSTDKPPGIDTAEGTRLASSSSTKTDPTDSAKFPVLSGTPDEVTSPVLNQQTEHESTSTNVSKQTVAGLQRSVSMPSEQVLVKSSFKFRPGAEYIDFPCKFQCPPQQIRFTADTRPGMTSPTPTQRETAAGSRPRDVADGAESVTSEYGNSSSGAKVNERSPLIQHATSPPPLIADATSFVNVAAVTTESPDVSRHVTIASTTSVSGPTSDSPEVSTTTRNKRRKMLSIKIHSKDSNKDINGIRQLSAAEERKIDEAMQLATDFARLGTQEHGGLLTPKSMGSGSSKESLESPGHTSASGVFRFAGFRRRGNREEKRTFVDALSLTCNATDIFTPDAQAAYNQLVSASPPASATETMITKLPCRRDLRRAHRLVPEAPAPRPPPIRRLQRMSLSESSDGSVNIPSTLTQRQTGVAGRPLRAAYQRSASMVEEREVDGARDDHRIELVSVSSSDTTLSPGDERKLPDGDDTLTSPPLERAPSPPPPMLPPRVPLRPPSRQRRHPSGSSTGSATGKRHSVFHEAQRTSALRPTPSVDVALPRRVTRGATSTSDTVDIRTSTSTTPDSDGGASAVALDSVRDSNDSVFGSSGSSSGDENADIPSSPPPPPLPARRSTSADRLNPRELGLNNPVDAFWCHRVDFDQSTLSRSELNLLNELGQEPAAAQPRYETSDAVSYEDLMEFALDGPRHRVQSEDSECDEVRLMRKLLSKDVSVDECMDALSDTKWDVHNAIKLVKLSQLLKTGLASKDACKDALMTSQWNVQVAAAYLLNHHHQQQQQQHNSADDIN